MTCATGTLSPAASCHVEMAVPAGFSPDVKNQQAGCRVWPSDRVCLGETVKLDDIATQAGRHRLSNRTSDLVTLNEPWPTIQETTMNTTTTPTNLRRVIATAIFSAL